MTTTPPRTDAATRLGLSEWDAEGGAQPGLPVPATAAAPELTADDELLLRLGAALVHEWATLPMPTRRALYDRAVSGPVPARDLSLKRDMAIFLHAGKGAAPQR